MFFFSRKTQPHPETAAIVPKIEAQIEFVLYTDDMSGKELLDTLRCNLIEFTEAYNLTWAVTRFFVATQNPDAVIPLQIKLTEDQDVVYTIDGENTFYFNDAARLLDSARLEAVVF